MKKFASVMMSLAILISAVPVAAYGATSTEDAIIDKHGAKTYLGSVSSWGATWNESNFEEVTNDDVTYTGNLTIKSGDVKNVTVTGGNVTVTDGNLKDLTVSSNDKTLTVTTGVMDDVVCSGKMTVTDGTIGSIESDGDLTLNGGTIKRTIACDDQITFSGNVTVGGAVSAEKIVSSSSSVVKVNNTVTADTSFTLTGNSFTADELKGSGTAELELKAYTGRLPKVTSMYKISVDASSDVTAGTRIDAGTLSIAQEGDFMTTYPLELGTLIGPGTLTIDAGDLLIHTSVTGKPLLLFNKIVQSGQIAFKADSGRVEEDDVSLYDFELDATSSGGYDLFKLTSSLTDGITFNLHESHLNSKSSSLIKTTVKPKFSEFATGTKMVWELHGDTKSFTKSEDSTNNSCKVSFNNSVAGTYSAKLVAYLVDAKGDRLTDYKSDSCMLYADTSSSSGTTTTNPSTVTSGITLDTSKVTISSGGTYWVLAVTSSKTPPVQLSYNSGVAKVGKAVAYNSNGKVGWLYPVTGVAKGAVTIDIGGQKMVTTVAGGSIVVDTSSYTMNLGGKYYIGVKMYGLNKNNLNVHSGNACTTVQYSGKNKSGTDIYLITGNHTGIGSVSFDIIGGQSVTTEIIVQSVGKPHGVSGRLVAAG